MRAALDQLVNAAVGPAAGVFAETEGEAYLTLRDSGRWSARLSKGADGRRRTAVATMPDVGDRGR